MTLSRVRMEALSLPAEMNELGTARGRVCKTLFLHVSHVRLARDRASKSTHGRKIRGISLFSESFRKIVVHESLRSSREGTPAAVGETGNTSKGKGRRIALQSREVE